MLRCHLERLFCLAPLGGGHRYSFHLPALAVSHYFRWHEPNDPIYVAAVTFARLIASFFGCGFAPVAPGTVGSLAALPLGAAVIWFAPGALPFVALLTTLGGLWAVHAARVEGDPGWVVIDEVAGQWLALAGLAHFSIGGLLAAFVLFRVLDILKPGPVGWADRQHGAAGIMADDVIAGAIAAAILWAMQNRWPDILG